MNKEDNRNTTYSYTPEELGLKKIIADGHRYIDVTPLWIDSKESRRIQDIIQAGSPHSEETAGRRNNIK